jgi:hypothetical protein
MVSFKKIVVAILLLSGFVKAQKSEFHYQGIIKATATISPGKLLSSGATTMSLHGFLEYFPEDKISLRGDSYYFLGIQEKPSYLYQNSTMKFGGLYHWHTKKRTDFYVGLQSGLNFAQPMGQDANGKDYYYKFKIAPVISPLTGVTVYFGKLFNVFLEASYIQGRYMGDGFTKIDLSEVRFSAGLGFHFATHKKDCDCNK